jgi:hypothetical protein
MTPGRPEEAPDRKSDVAVLRNQKIVVGVVFVSAMFMNIMDITIAPDDRS